VTVTVQLEPNVEARLLAQARAQGVPLEAYLQAVVDQIAARGGPPDVSIEESEIGLDTLAEGCEQLPVLPPGAYRRESIYGDG
jgi:hypothetical protein